MNFKTQTFLKGFSSLLNYETLLIMRLHFKEILKRDDDEPTLENLEMKCQLEIIQGQTFIKSRHLAQKPTFKFILA